MHARTVPGLGRILKIVYVLLAPLVCLTLLLPSVKSVSASEAALPPTGVHKIDSLT